MLYIFFCGDMLVVDSPWTTTINMCDFERIFISVPTWEEFRHIFLAYYLASLTFWTCLSMIFDILAKARPTKHAPHCIDKPCSASV